MTFSRVYEYDHENSFEDYVGRVVEGVEGLFYCWEDCSSYVSIAVELLDNQYKQIKDEKGVVFSIQGDNSLGVSYTIKAKTNHKELLNWLSTRIKPCVGMNSEEIDAFERKQATESKAARDRGEKYVSWGRGSFLIMKHSIEIIPHSTSPISVW